MKKLHERSVWLFFVRFYILFLLLFVVLSPLIIGIGTEVLFLEVDGMMVLGIIVLVLLPAISSYFWAWLTYENYKYELREDGFHKSLGVIWKKDIVIPYNKIQNVDIYRGILARLLGLADINIQTAGFSGTYSRRGIGAEGQLPGLSREDAEKLRDKLVKRSSGSPGTHSP